MLQTTGQAQFSIKDVVAESFSLSPSALVTLFSIDISDLGFQQGIISQTEVSLQQNTVFNFHNNINLTTRSIFWQGIEYVAAPIQAQGFEYNLKGSNPVPKLSMTVSDDGIPLLSMLKQRLLQLGNDIVGAKLTRIRTYARFLDLANFVGGVPPIGFSPDQNAELPRDIYYLDRKSQENKNTIEYELSPIFEVEGIKLPGRIVSQDQCPWQYRGEGCLYEYANRYDASVHKLGSLPQSAPPVATFLDEQIQQLVSGVPFVDKGQYNVGQIYNKGDTIFVYHRGLKYYFVSKVNSNNNSPPNDTYWISDQCSKKVIGCKLRWNNISSGLLPFGGFVSTNRFS